MMINDRERETDRQQDNECTKLIAEKVSEVILMCVSFCLSLQFSLFSYAQLRRRDRESHLPTTASSSKYNF